MERSKILFVSRAYPPIIGGIENQNYELSVWLAHCVDITTIANRYGKKALPFFLPSMMVFLPFIARRYDVILFGDGVLAILSWWTKLFHKNIKTASIIHGLDITYDPLIYQKLWVQKFLHSVDRFIAVGNQTISEATKRGLPRDRFHFVPNGIDAEKFSTHKATRDDLMHIIGKDHKDQKIILTSGRLETRKGVAWFIRSVLPQLDDTIIYVVVGEGVDRPNIERAIDETSLHKRVILLGRVSDDDLKTLWHTCDVFVQPNIKISADMEGFGISVIEAAACGIPVIASHLEGLKDAIIDNKNGFSIDSENADIWIAKVNEVLAPDFDKKAFGQKAQEYTIQHFHWGKIAKRYAEILSDM